MTVSETVSAGQLRAFIERIERLEEEKRTIADDIKEVKSEAKSCGFDVGAINAIVKLRRMDSAERQEKEAILDVYKAALGMLPLEQYAARDDASQSYAEAKGRDADGFPPAIPFHPKPVTDTQEQPEPGADFNNGEDHDADSGQRIGRQDGEQRGSAPVSSSVGRGESTDDGDQGQGAGASGADRSVGPVAGIVDSQDQDGRSRHVGGEVDHEVAPPDGDAFVAVKGSARFLTNAAGVEPSLSVSIPHSAVTPPAADKTGAAPLPSSAAPVAISDDDVPAFLRKERKPLRPNCQHPDNCAGYGTHTCHSCTVAAREVEPA